MYKINVVEPSQYACFLDTYGVIPGKVKTIMLLEYFQKIVKL